MNDGEPSELLGRLGLLEQAIVDFQRRSAHREAVIDRLHEENQQLRIGQRRDILEPVVVDLVHIYDGLRAQATRLTADSEQAGMGKMFASFADDIEMALDRCGLDIVHAVVGDMFDAAVHAAVGIEPCDRPDQHNRVAIPISVGLRARDTGRVRRQAKARFFRHRPAEWGTLRSTPPQLDGAVEVKGEA